MTSLTTSFSPPPSPSRCLAEAAPDCAAAILWALAGEGERRAFLGEGDGAGADAPKAVTPGPPATTTARRAPNASPFRRRLMAYLLDKVAPVVYQRDSLPSLLPRSRRRWRLPAARS